ncbi:hypothetical protein NWE60_01480 [Mycoplasmopsis felis]|nr:hypothetical protein [Mycoplasmopsis felis]WAM01310.1 hypothetical protein NWE60_01480 [Mycoplasmopsis felis]
MSCFALVKASFNLFNLEFNSVTSTLLLLVTNGSTSEITLYKASLIDLYSEFSNSVKYSLDSVTFFVNLSTNSCLLVVGALSIACLCAFNLFNSWLNLSKWFLYSWSVKPWVKYFEYVDTNAS